jgi:hypothetical protein
VRRKNGTDLVDNEVRLLGVALDLVNQAGSEPASIFERRFHGYEVVRQMQRDAQATQTRPLNHATIYRGLRHLEEIGALDAEWEDAEDAEQAGREARPRRYYRLTRNGLQALCSYEAGQAYAPLALRFLTP